MKSRAKPFPAEAIEAIAKVLAEAALEELLKSAANPAPEHIAPSDDASTPDLAHVLRFYIDAFPAFRSKPLGAPHSSARRAQDTHIEWEDKARAALKAAGL